MKKIVVTIDNTTKTWQICCNKKYYNKFIGRNGYECSEMFGNIT